MGGAPLDTVDMVYPSIPAVGVLVQITLDTLLAQARAGNLWVHRRAAAPQGTCGQRGGRSYRLAQRRPERLNC